ncbi:SRPBCC family protein [Serinicoccus kebangsaanensis]|uniref:SRPBCC family protein n=1 Tax=Serinicoccus kebangsaanensis TaxID=2602069 RepID=UPI00124C6A7E|nr:SRPBCC family protein [Serinicoccus kebangsaanensis]
MPSVHVGTTIGRDPAAVYDYAADPQHLPAWAAGLAEGEVVDEGGSVVVHSPMGRVRVRFAPRNGLGVLDHEVTLPSGETVLNPMRVLPHPEGAEVVFTVRQRDVSDEDFHRDVAAVEADLERLRAVLEG